MSLYLEKTCKKINYGLLYIREFTTFLGGVEKTLVFL